MAEIREYTVDRHPSGTPPKAAMGASIAEAILGISAVALTIIGLVGVIPDLLLAISTIVIGAALLFEGGAVAARFNALMNQTGSDVGSGAHWGGMTAEFLAGAAGIALGILSLLGVAPAYLLPIAAIVFGVALVLDSGVNTRISSLEAKRMGNFEFSNEVVRESARATAGIQVLVGLAAITLGTLALLGVSPLILTLVAMLCVGSANLLTGSLITARVMKLFQH